MNEKRTTDHAQPVQATFSEQPPATTIHDSTAINNEGLTKLDGQRATNHPCPVEGTSTGQQQIAINGLPARSYAREEDEPTLLELLLVLKPYWRMIILPAFVVSFLVGLYTFTRPRFYQARTTLVPPIELMQKTGSLGAGLGGLGGLQQSMLSNILGETNLTEMYVGILGSRTITEKIVDRFDLKTVYEEELMADVFKVLRKRTDFEVRNDGIISVQVMDLDPNRASAMANALVEELDQQNRRLSAGSVTSKRKFLEKRLAELKEELSSIDQIPAHEARLKEVIFEMLSQEFELARIEEAKSMPTIQVLDQAIPPEIGVARGTIQKALLAGIATVMLGVFVAFGRENLKKVKTIETNE